MILSRGTVSVNGLIHIFGIVSNTGTYSYKPTFVCELKNIKLSVLPFLCQIYTQYAQAVLGVNGFNPYAAGG